MNILTKGLAKFGNLIITKGLGITIYKGVAKRPTYKLYKKERKEIRLPFFLREILQEFSLRAIRNIKLNYEYEIYAKRINKFEYNFGISGHRKIKFIKIHNFMGNKQIRFGYLIQYIELD